MNTWRRGWCVCKRAALCLEKGSVLGMSLCSKDSTLKNNVVLFLASRFSSGANYMQRRRQDVKGARNLQESHFGEDVKSKSLCVFINVAMRLFSLTAGAISTVGYIASSVHVSGQAKGPPTIYEGRQIYFIPQKRATTQ